jgi:hypothetical protein
MRPRWLVVGFVVVVLAAVLFVWKVMLLTTGGPG